MKVVMQSFSSKNKQIIECSEFKWKLRKYDYILINIYMLVELLQIGF